MQVHEPIIVVGVGRSGSTIFHEMLSEHPEVAWLSGRLCDTYPKRPAWYGHLMRFIDVPLVGRGLRRRFSPGEGYRFWERLYRGFATPCRDLLASDVTNSARRDIAAAMAAVLTSARHRLLLKITGWPRVGFLQETFPDARFIHVVRDPRAVVNSLIHVDWWTGWGGPHNWDWGELTPAQLEEWAKHNHSFVALAAIQWKMMIDAMNRARTSVVEGHFLELRYEDLCSDLNTSLRKVLTFCGLESSLSFERSVKRYTLRNTNDKWLQDLTIPQQQSLQDVLGSHLAMFGYEQ